MQITSPPSLITRTFNRGQPQLITCESPTTYVWIPAFMKEMMPFHNLKICTLLDWWIIVICPTAGSLSHVIGRSTESRVGLQYQHFASVGVCVSVNDRICGWWCCVSGERWSAWHPVEHFDLQLNLSWSFTALASCQCKCVYVRVYVCM